MGPVGAWGTQRQAAGLELQVYFKLKVSVSHGASVRNNHRAPPLAGAQPAAGRPAAPQPAPQPADPHMRIGVRQSQPMGRGLESGP